jgi:hypothetical protein
MTEETKRVGPGFDLESKKVRYDYIKSNYFRVIHVDGIFGGNTPRPGIIQMAVWNERWPIPKQTSYEIIPEPKMEAGKIGKEIFEERVQRSAVGREVEVQLIMNIETAKTMQEWLGKHIKEYERMKEKVKRI